jgi:glutamine amidotransferase
MGMIAVVDYGMGNLRSVTKALEHVAEEQRVVLTSDPAVVAAAGRVVFPGQGAARDCMRALDEHGLRSAVLAAADDRPFLGLCMGLQVLLEHSEENQGTTCLGKYPGEVRYFGEDLHDPKTGERLKIPHMGWNQVHQLRSHPLWRGIPDQSRFYFVHSYYVDPSEADLTVGSTYYGREFTSAVARANVFAVQFHPEKSAANGLKLLENFAHWDGGP